MKIIKVSTGFGYMKDSEGRIVSKAELPCGKHPIGNEYEYVEVANAKELEAIDLYVKPESQDIIDERMIQDEIRKDAIARLKSLGKLSKDFKDFRDRVK